MGMGRADEDDEVEVEGVADAFEDAHQSDDDGDYDANAEPEESDDDEEDGGIMSPSKIALAKAEKARLREQKKMQRAELEKMREQQNAAIAKVSANARMSRLSARSLPPGPSRRLPPAETSPGKPRGGGTSARRAVSRARIVETRARADRAHDCFGRTRETRVERIWPRTGRARFTTARARGRRAVRPSRARLASASNPDLFLFAIV